MATKYKCRTCQQRWPTWQGRCRRCIREAGGPDWSTKAVEAERSNRRWAREHLIPAKAAVSDPLLEPNSPRPPMLRVYGGVEYEVTFDGT